MDLIDRQAAIDAFTCDGSFFVYGADVCKAIVSRLKQLPAAEPEPRWILCSERLPEHDGEKYLVTLYSDRINVISVRISYCYMNRGGFWSDVPVGYKVTAWMPLPEPYREEGD